MNRIQYLRQQIRQAERHYRVATSLMAQQGWYASDGDDTLHFPEARSADEAGQMFIDAFDFGRKHYDPEFGPLGTVTVRVWRMGADDEDVLDEQELQYDIEP
jgi:hypothetical protein